MLNINETVRSHAMLATFTTRSWTGQALDRSASRAAADAAHSVPAAFKTVKNLLVGADSAHKAVISAQAAARGFHAANTLPWGAGTAALAGPRLLATVNFTKYLDSVGKAKDNYDRALELFLSTYEASRDTAMELLADAAPDMSVYPTLSELPGLFAVEIGFSPLATGKAFEGVLPKDLADPLIAAFESDTAEAFTRARAFGVQQLQLAVENVIERMETGRFKDAAFTNITDMLPVLQGYDYKDSAVFGMLLQEAGQLFNGVNPVVYRGDAAETVREREIMANRAKALLAEIETYQKDVANGTHN